MKSYQTKRPPSTASAQSAGTQSGQRIADMQLSWLLHWACAVVALSTSALAETRVYYVGAVEEMWDYAPGGGDLSNFQSTGADR